MRPRHAFLLALLVAVLAFATWIAVRPPRAPRSDMPQPDSTGTGFKSARLYFASARGESLVVESREQLDAQNLHDRVVSLVEELERGPRAQGLRTLPAGTAVQHVYLDDQGLLTLDLSREFRDGFKGGSGAEFLAIAALTRTLGANLPEVKRVMLVCAGQPLPTLGGHLPLDRPIDVADLP